MRLSNFRDRRTMMVHRLTPALAAMLMAGTALLSLAAAGCSGGSNNPLSIVPTATATATQTPAPTATSTPIPISATQNGTGLVLTDFKASGNTLWTANRGWLLRLLKQFEAGSIVAFESDDPVLIRHAGSEVLIGCTEGSPGTGVARVSEHRKI